VYTDTELLHRIALTRIPLVGAVTAKNLISYCGSAEAVFREKKGRLLKIPGVGEKIIRNLKSPELLSQTEPELKFIRNNGIKVYFYADKDYPHRLKHFNDAPPLLYYKGNADLNARRTVAIVGTRKPSPQGVAICQEIVQGLQAYNPLLVSGLAYGIDITAHRKCLELSMENIAVVGHGLSTIYPAQHKRTAQEIISCGGLLTEFSSTTKPDRENFPMRNRIIAGLADAVIVIETARSGGSMITAEIANSYNKDVFAVPGRLKDPNSQGCNHLIKTHKAALIESAADLGYIMRWEVLDQKKAAQTTLFQDLNETEKDVLALLRKNESLGIDHIAYSLKKQPSEMAGIMLSLEFKGIVKSIPGNRFVIIA
jgi:DNA processing protein